jgi:hypothetical protein
MTKEMIMECEAKKMSLNVCQEERESIERETRNQRDNKKWHDMRRERVTGLKCGIILNQRTKTTALLRHCLYQKTLNPPPLSISWGIRNEAVAIDAYIEHKHSIENYSIVVEKCGFIVHPVKGWIGASPDGQVTDLTAAEPRGLIEVKCPFTKREASPMEACKDPNFYCEIIGSKIHLKHTHPYYHQV